MALLLLLSVLTWGIIFEKTLQLRRLYRRAARFEKVFWSGATVDEIFQRIGTMAHEPMAAVFSAAMREWQRAAARGTTKNPTFHQNLLGRIDRVIGLTISREIARMEGWLSFLATVGSTAPFIGLFGTVWGVMSSFLAIAGARNASLVVVAPGIAEALFATAMGLFAAIPAVVAYNKLSGELDRYGQRLENFAGDFATIISRQLEEVRR